MRNCANKIHKIFSQVLFVALVFSFINVSEATAQIMDDEGVIVENKRSAYQPYLQRRSKWGISLAVQLEQYFPKDYFSVIQGQYYDVITDGADIDLVGLEAGLKYNIAFGSVSALLGYSSGKTAAENRGLKRFDVSLTKISGNLTLDGIWSEPLVAPYVQGGMHQFSILEESVSGTEILSESPQIEWNFNYRAGIMIQLNWIEKSIDPNTHYEAFRSSGLENTYIDIFYAEYMRPSTVSESAEEDGEPDHASSHFGVGLKMEF